MISKRFKESEIIIEFRKLLFCSFTIILVLILGTIYNTHLFSFNIKNENNINKEEINNKINREEINNKINKEKINEKDDINKGDNINKGNNIKKKEVKNNILDINKQKLIKKKPLNKVNKKTQIKKQNSIKQISKNKNLFTNKDILLLARLIFSEAGNQTYNGKVAVGNVVRYRMKKDNKSLSSIIYQKGQFDGVKTKQFNETPPKECIKASYDVLINNTIVISNAYYYVNLDLCKKPNWAKKSNFIMRIGKHWFYSF